MTAQELRDKFLKFFESKGHKIISSSSLIPENDQTVLFTTAGMQQFKPYFAGNADIEKEFGNKNLASVQKCFRTSDIDSVGDESHLTFFEMLGNFSLGGYGKKEAIEYAWELMTSDEWYGLPKDRFFATVFAGDDEIPVDKQSEKFWKEVTPGIKVKKFGKQENFWPNPIWVGTCGPSSELHYVLDDGSNIEVWNLVFTQYLHNEDGSFKDLGQVNIDTGMGLERLAMISQGKNSIFETDLFSDIIKIIEEYTQKDYSEEENRPHIRVIADHLKGATFLIADGVIPSNKERGYILRRLLRRAAVKMFQLKGGLPPLSGFGAICEEVLIIYDGVHSIDRAKHRDIVGQVVENELNKFSDSLDRGLKELQKIDKIDGKIAFNLYQTFGFPYEITEELFRQKGQKIDREQFKVEFEKHIELSRKKSFVLR